MTHPIATKRPSYRLNTQIKAQQTKNKVKLNQTLSSENPALFALATGSRTDTTLQLSKETAAPSRQISNKKTNATVALKAVVTLVTTLGAHLVAADKSSVSPNSMDAPPSVEDMAQIERDAIIDGYNNFKTVSHYALLIWVVCIILIIVAPSRPRAMELHRGEVNPD